MFLKKEVKKQYLYKLKKVFDINESFSKILRLRLNLSNSFVISE